MTLTEEKIHELERFGIELTLDRIQSLLKRLGNPEKDLKFIHVAGTNGKGSICRFIYSILREAGYNVGIYTSPYLTVFNERIESDGNLITDDELDYFGKTVFEKIDEMKADGERVPTEFEATTALAMLYYKEKKCDYVVLEVGLGGRGDATNVIENPLLSVIGTISFDHTERLGNTLSKIAFEKSGIIKPGCPVLTSATAEEAISVIRNTAKDRGSMYFHTSDASVAVLEDTLDGNIFYVNLCGKSWENVKTSMPGIFQVQNAVCALYAAEILRTYRDVEISDEAILSGLYKSKNIGRMEVIKKRNPLIVIDGAHNPEGADAFAKTMTKNLFGKKVLMVTGILADKDVNGILESFLTVTKDFIVTEPFNHRAMKAEELAGRIKAMGGNVIEIAPSFEEAVIKAKENYDEYDAVVFAGSLYMIGVMRGLLC